MLFNIWLTQYWFFYLGLISCLSSFVFSLNFANTVSFHSLNCEVAYLVLSVIDSIHSVHVSRAVVFLICCF